MKKRIIKSISLTAMALLLTVSNIIGAYAAETQSGSSKATFELTSDGSGEVTNPVDPEYPDYNIDPDPDGTGGNGTTGNTGPIRIDYVSNFIFGSQAISSDAQQFHAALVSADAEHGTDGRIEVPNFVQVSDLRGTGAGWTLYVKQDEQFKVTEGEYKDRALTGARLTLDNITANTAMEEDYVETPGSILFDLMDEYQEIMTAETGNGLGIHVAHFGEYDQGVKDSALTSVTLNVPDKITKIEAPYATTLTWTLAAVPGNGDGGDDEAELESIAVTNEPDKTSYIEGERFSDAGMEVTAYYTDGTAEVVSDYSLNPTMDTDLSTSHNAITISYTEDDITKTATQAITVDAKALTGIAVTEAPNKIVYTEGEAFNKAGMVVTASYNDGTSKPVTTYTYSPTTTLTTSTKNITVSYTEGGVTKTATQAITVNAKVLSSISITREPTKTIYTEGESFNKTNMIVTARYNNGTSKAVTTYTYSPSGKLTTSHNKITVSYTEGNVTKTTTQAITVKSKDTTEIDSIEDKDDFDEIEIDGDVWIILSKNKSKGTAELLHKKGLSGKRQYHGSTGGASGSWGWEKSDIRTYLNNTFYKTLSADFQKRMIDVEKTTVLPGRFGGTTKLTEKVYLLGRTEYTGYESKFKGTLYNYGLRSSIDTGWWLRDGDGMTGNGIWYVITDVKSGAAYASHGAEGLQGVRPVVTVKYK